MASGFKFAKTSSQINSGSFVPLSATRLSEAPVSLKLFLKAGQNAVIRLDSSASGGGTASAATEMVFETGVPNTTSFVDVGAIDPSRVWIRSGGAALTDHVYWISSWV